MLTLKRIFILIFLLVSLASCQNNQQMQIFHLEKETIKGVDTKSIREFFVVSHAEDKTQIDLLKLINIYNQKTLDEKIVGKYKVYTRSFHKETHQTSRHFVSVKDDLFNSDYISEHRDNLILDITWRNYDDWPVIKRLYQNGKEVKKEELI